MRTSGKPYKATRDDFKKRNVKQRRAVYRTSAEPSIEQKSMIKKLEQLFHEEYEGSGDPYQMLRYAEYIGIELSEEELRADGKWYPIVTEDAELSLMHRGAL